VELLEEIRWFQNEIAACEKLIHEVESDPFYGPTREEILTRMHATLDAHRKTLADLVDQLTLDDD
jgi:hypothetical protein